MNHFHSIKSRRRDGIVLSLFLPLAVILVIPNGSRAASQQQSQAGGWSGASARNEIRPSFDYKASGGPGAHELLIIDAAGREAVDGHWTKTFPIKGGGYYRFHASRRVKNVPSPRRSTFARLLWRDAQGHAVFHDEPGAHSYAPDNAPMA